MGRGALMVDWADLQHAYGNAADIPMLLERWEHHDDQVAENELWSRLFHQGSVYSASFAALPILVEIAERSTGRRRREAVLLATAIVGSTGAVGERPETVVQSVSPALERLALDCLTRANTDDFIYLLQGLAAARGDRFWGERLSFLADEEFEGRCESCDSDFFVAIGSHGCFSAAGFYESNPSLRRIPIAPAESELLPFDGLWLAQMARTHGRSDVAESLCYVFGSTRCPVCSAELSVEAAIKRVYATGAP